VRRCRWRRLIKAARQREQHNKFDHGNRVQQQEIINPAVQTPLRLNACACLNIEGARPGSSPTHLPIYRTYIQLRQNSTQANSPRPRVSRSGFRPTLPTVRLPHQHRQRWEYRFPDLIKVNTANCAFNSDGSLTPAKRDDKSQLTEFELKPQSLGFWGLREQPAFLRFLYLTAKALKACNMCAECLGSG
jgi:hypothetical protein